MTPEQQAAIRNEVNRAVSLALDDLIKPGVTSQSDLSNNITDAAIAAHLKALETATSAPPLEAQIAFMGDLLDASNAALKAANAELDAARAEIKQLKRAVAPPPSPEAAPPIGETFGPEHDKIWAERQAGVQEGREQVAQELEADADVFVLQRALAFDLKAIIISRIRTGSKEKWDE